MRIEGGTALLPPSHLAPSIIHPVPPSTVSPSLPATVGSTYLYVSLSLSNPRVASSVALMSLLTLCQAVSRCLSFVIK